MKFTLDITPEHEGKTVLESTRVLFLVAKFGITRILELQARFVNVGTRYMTDSYIDQRPGYK